MRVEPDIACSTVLTLAAVEQVGLLCGRKISLVRALLYVIAQVLGACLGAGLIKAVRITSDLSGHA